MKPTELSNSRVDKLRQEFEAHLEKVDLDPNKTHPNREKVAELVECLRVYQAELEQQNQVLLETNADNERLRAHYSSLFALLPIPALIIDKKLNISESNESAKSLLTLNRFAGSHHISLVGLFTTECLNELNHAVLNCSKEKKTQVVRLNKPFQSSGSVFDIYLTNIEHARSEARNFLILIQDVTATTVIEKQQKLLNGVIEHSIDSVLIVSLDQEVRHVSRDLLALFKLPLDMPFTHLLQALPEGLRNLLKEFIGQCRHGNSEIARTIEISLNEPERPLFINIHGFVTESHDEHARCVGFIIRNETQRIEQEKNLELALRIFDQGDQALIVTDKHLNILQVNSAFETLTGYLLEETKELNLNDLSANRKDGNSFKAVWSKAAKLGKWEGEVASRNKQGTESLYWMSITSYPKHSPQPSHFIAVFHDITQQKENEQEINRLAYFDTLTGCGNRRLLQQHADAIMEEDDAQFSLFFFDLDLFKQVNDIHGHQIGDELLTALTNRLRHLIRDTDEIYRLGGDEFLLVFKELDLHDIGNKASKLIEASTSPFFIGRHQINISISIGIVRYPDDGKDFEALLKHADIALYQAKENGRRGYQFFDPELLSLMTRKVQIEKCLRQGLKSNELWCAFMPQIDVNTSKIKQVEVLSRWSSSLLGEVSPEEFIPIAEQTGLIKDITRLVLEKSLIELERLPEHINVSINVSPLDFKDENFFNELIQLLSAVNSKSERITIELTEGMLIEDIEQTQAKLARLKSKGVRISIDDFGTGHSSLSYLASFPIDELKIDKAFVEHIPNDHRQTSVCHAILSLAKSLNCLCVAEGVETQEQFEWLREQGCNLSQGFLHSKAVAINDLLVQLPN